MAREFEYFEGPDSDPDFDLGSFDQSFEGFGQNDPEIDPEDALHQIAWQPTGNQVDDTIR